MKHEGQLKVFLLLATRLTILFDSLRDREVNTLGLSIKMCVQFSVFISSGIIPSCFEIVASQVLFAVSP